MFVLLGETLYGLLNLKKTIFPAIKPKNRSCVKTNGAFDQSRSSTIHRLCEVWIFN